MQSFMPIHFFIFNLQTIKNGLAGPKIFRDFRETGPRVENLAEPSPYSYFTVPVIVHS